jgi:hypothetical protein
MQARPRRREQASVRTWCVCADANMRPRGCKRVRADANKHPCGHGVSARTRTCVRADAGGGERGVFGVCARPQTGARADASPSPLPPLSLPPFPPFPPSPLQGTLGRLAKLDFLIFLDVNFTVNPINHNLLEVENFIAF